MSVFFGLTLAVILAVLTGAALLMFHHFGSDVLQCSQEAQAQQIITFKGDALVYGVGFAAAASLLFLSILSTQWRFPEPMWERVAPAVALGALGAFVATVASYNILGNECLWKAMGPESQVSDASWLPPIPVPFVSVWLGIFIAQAVLTLLGIGVAAKWRQLYLHRPFQGA